MRPERSGMIPLHNKEGVRNGVRAIASHRATHAPHRTLLRGFGLSVGIAIAVGGCADDTFKGQQQREGTTPYAIVVDNHGCKWRIGLAPHQSEPDIHIQRKTDGSPDCAASGMEARRAAAENTDAVHDSPVGAAETPQ